MSDRVDGVVLDPLERAAHRDRRAVLLRPALLFADEPTSRLDLVTQEETVRCLVAQLAPHDCALVLVTHDEALARAVCDRRVTVGDDAALVGARR